MIERGVVEIWARHLKKLELVMRIVDICGHVPGVCTYFHDLSHEVKM